MVLSRSIFSYFFFFFSSLSLFNLVFCFIFVAWVNTSETVKVESTKKESYLNIFFILCFFSLSLSIIFILSTPSIPSVDMKSSATTELIASIFSMKTHYKRKFVAFHSDAKWEERKKRKKTNGKMYYFTFNYGMYTVVALSVLHECKRSKTGSK